MKHVTQWVFLGAVALAVIFAISTTAHLSPSEQRQARQSEIDSLDAQERDLLAQLQRDAAECAADAFQFGDRHAFVDACRQSNAVVAGVYAELITDLRARRGGLAAHQ